MVNLTPRSHTLYTPRSGGSGKLQRACDLIICCFHCKSVFVMLKTGFSSSSIIAKSASFRKSKQKKNFPKINSCTQPSRRRGHAVRGREGVSHTLSHTHAHTRWQLPAGLVPGGWTGCLFVEDAVI